MIGKLIHYILVVSCMTMLPFVTLGVIRKVKARMQNRVGASILQPLFDFLKLLKKEQTISDTTTWLFQTAVAVNMAIILLVAWLVPWLSFKPAVPGDDLFLLLYLLATLRFMTILSALDVGSSFSAFGASREAFLGMLVEPAIFISLAALGLTAHNTSLSVIFDSTHTCSIYDLPVWLAAALGLYLASIVDLSRMPVDDPTTHLELTMVHEAMILENSGKNLALVEYAHYLRMTILYGLIVQCLLHAASYAVHLSPLLTGILSVIGVLCVAVTTGMVESLTVKLRWTGAPAFIAYALTMSLFATAGALIGEIYGHHGL
jgi:formate hydrogenlyase subunit 4